MARAVGAESCSASDATAQTVPAAREGGGGALRGGGPESGKRKVLSGKGGVVGGDCVGVWLWLGGGKRDAGGRGGAGC